MPQTGIYLHSSLLSSGVVHNSFIKLITSLVLHVSDWWPKDWSYDFFDIKAQLDDESVIYKNRNVPHNHH
jgi:hypothetical protein